MTRAIIYNWTLTSTKVISNFGNEVNVPQKKLRDDYCGITITCVPYRDYFEPCIPYDNGCQVRIYFDDGFPPALLKSLSFIKRTTGAIPLEEMDRQITLLFFIEGDDQKNLNLIFAKIEQYFILKLSQTNQDQRPMQMGIDHLRRFVLLPNQQHYLPVHSKQLFFGTIRDQIDFQPSLRDDEMADSVFGQSSHTAQRLRRS
jgi:hypothetical protein